MESLEFLSSTPIVNGEDRGQTNIKKHPDAKSFRIKSRKLMQFANYISGVEGLNELDNDVDNISISYHTVFEGIRYNVERHKN